MMEFNIIPQVLARLHQHISERVGNTADQLATTSREAAPERSGFLKSTVYAVTAQHDTYGQGVLAPPEGATLLPEVERPTDDCEALVAVAASYGVYVELGDRNMAPESFLTPSAEHMSAQYELQFTGIDEALEREFAR